MRGNIHLEVVRIEAVQRQQMIAGLLGCQQHLIVLHSEVVPQQANSGPQSRHDKSSETQGAIIKTEIRNELSN